MALSAIGIEQMEKAISDWLESTNLHGNSQLTAIQSGAINTSYRLTIGKQSFFVKSIVPNPMLTRASAFDLQNKLAREGIAPHSDYLSKDGKIQIDKWLDKPWQSLAELVASQEQKIEHLADAHYHIHSCKVPTAKLDLPKHWLGYLDNISNRLSTTQIADFKTRSQELENVWIQGLNEEVCLCHHDLAFGHVMLNSQDQLRILDWEYAAIGNPYFDIACSALVNQLSQTELILLCEHYGRKRGFKGGGVVQRVQAQIPVAQLTNDLWMACFGD